MLTDLEIRAIGQKVVDKSKRTSKVDTGALKRSISFTYVKGVLIFRELFYGQFGSNSELEKNAKKLVPRGTAWKIIYTKFGGGTQEIGRTRAGRATQKSTLSSLISGGSNNIKALIARNKAKKAAADGKEKN